jgi:hypothetical protein
MESLCGMEQEEVMEVSWWSLNKWGRRGVP